MAKKTPPKTPYETPPPITGDIIHEAVTPEDNPTAAELNTLAEQLLNATQGTLDVTEQSAKWCVRADELLNADEKEAFAERVCLHPTTFSKYVTIGKREILWTPEVKAHLPRTSVSTIYELAKWKDEEIARAIAEKALRPTATLKELKEWRYKDVDTSSTNGRKEVRHLFAEMELRVSLSPEREAALEREVKNLDLRYPELKITLERDKTTKALSEYEQNRKVYIIQQASKAIKEELKRRGKRADKHMKNAMSIDNSTPLNVVAANLEYLGLKSGYQELLRDADRHADVPQLLIEWSRNEWDDENQRNANAEESAKAAETNAWLMPKTAIERLSGRLTS